MKMNDTSNLFSLSAWKVIALDILRRDGIVRMPALPEENVKEIIDYLWNKPVYNAHVQAKATQPPVKLGDAIKNKNWQMFSHSMEDIVTAPYFIEMAISMLDFVKDYFDGEKPKLYSMNAFWTQPAAGPEYADTHWWHRDPDDRKQLSLFIYGTQIKRTADGAHLYQKGTHRISDNDLKDEKGNSRHYTQPTKECVEVITGVEGTLFFTDPSGLHMGLRPRNTEGEGHKTRMLAWARFGVSNPPASYGWDKLSPVSKELLGKRFPKDEEVQEQIRLVIS